MSENLPPDLIALQIAYEAAHLAVSDYVTARTTEAGAPWADTDDVELTRLRAAREAARRQLWAHPAHQEVRQSGRWKDLKIAAGAPGWKK